MLRVVILKNHSCHQNLENKDFNLRKIILNLL